MNIRRVHLFCLVVQHGGISRAISHLPSGMQQPALSEQMQLLEEEIGAVLFQRQPFLLTAEGREFFDRASGPIFTVERCFEELRLGGHPLLRVAADEALLRHYIGSATQELTRLEPHHRLKLRSGSAEHMCDWLRDGEIDVAVSTLRSTLPVGLSRHFISSVPLILIVPEDSPIRSADELWRAPQALPALITPADNDPITELFDRGLRQGGIRWPARVAAGSAAAVASFVVSTNSVGLTVDVPCFVRNNAVRRLPLQGFDPVTIGALWRTTETRKLGHLLHVIKQCTPERSG